jgi:hypothetical protein
MSVSDYFNNVELPQHVVHVRNDFKILERSTVKLLAWVLPREGAFFWSLLRKWILADITARIETMLESNLSTLESHMLSPYVGNGAGFVGSSDAP